MTTPVVIHVQSQPTVRFEQVIVGHAVRAIRISPILFVLVVHGSKN